MRQRISSDTVILRFWQLLLLVILLGGWHWLSRDPQMACGLGTFGIGDLDPNKVVEHLWKTRRILVTPIVHAPDPARRRRENRP